MEVVVRQRKKNHRLNLYQRNLLVERYVCILMCVCMHEIPFMLMFLLQRTRASESSEASEDAANGAAAEEGVEVKGEVESEEEKAKKKKKKKHKKQRHGSGSEVYMNVCVFEFVSVDQGL